MRFRTNQRELGTLRPRMFAKPALSRMRCAGPLAIALLVLAPCDVGVRAADPQPYTVTIVPTAQPDLDHALTDASTLVSLREKAPVGPFALATRARDDIGRLNTCLQTYVYYKSNA